MNRTLLFWVIIGVPYLLDTVEGQTTTGVPQYNKCTCVAKNYCVVDVKDIDPSLDITKSCRISEICCPWSNVTASPKYPSCGTTGYTTFKTSFRGQYKEDIVCLQSNLDTRVVEFGLYPWAAFIFKTSQNRQEFVCGASLLSSKVVLTAAHCIHNQNVGSLRVRAGALTINGVENTKSYQDRTISIMYQHPRFDSASLHHDLALLLLSEPLELESHVAPICVPPLPDEYPNYEDPSHLYDPDSCLVIGWDKNSLSPYSTYQKALKQVEVNMVSRESCQQQLRATRLGSNFTLDPSFMCAIPVSESLRADSCKGDGGGPLFCLLQEDGHRYVQVGVVSWGIGCDNRLPSVYTSLEANLDWLTLTFRVLNDFPCESSHTKDTGNSCKAKTTADMQWTYDKVSNCQFAEQIMTCEKKVCNPEEKICCPRLALPKKDEAFWARVPSFRAAVGSSVKYIGQFPHMALIGYGENLNKSIWLCGGSLISSKFILSAAHCSHAGSSGNAKWALLGELRRDGLIRNGKRQENLFSIVKHHIHPDYQPPMVNNDIMLFELEMPINFRALSVPVAPICLHDSETLFYAPYDFIRTDWNNEPPVIKHAISANNSALTLGWGTTGADSDVSNVLTKTAVNILPESNCKESYHRDRHLANGFESQAMICAGDLILGQDSCPGNSGGPLQVVNGSKWVLIGIVSYGPSLCGDKKDPSIYTKVAHYMDWIKTIVLA